MWRVLSGIAQIRSTRGTVAKLSQPISGQRPEIIKDLRCESLRYLAHVCPSSDCKKSARFFFSRLIKLTHTSLGGMDFPIVKGLKWKRRKRRIFLQLHELRAGEKRKEHVARASGPILYEATLHCGFSSI